MKVKLFTALILVMFLAGMAMAQTPPAGGPQTINLKTGFNFAAFTIKPSLSPAQFKTQFASVDEIYSYNASSGSFLSVSEGTLTALNSGRGYIIKAKEAAAISFDGSGISSIGDIALKGGFNLVGISKPAGALTFSALMANNSSIRGLYKFNSTSGSFIQVIRNASGAVELADGIDPVFTQGQSYYMNMTGDNMLNYDSGQIAIGSGSVSVSAFSLSKTSDMVDTFADYDLGLITATVFYSDSTSKTVAPSWTIKSGGGVLGGTTYTAPITARIIMLTAAYTEGGVVKTADLTLSVKLPSGLAGYWNFDEGSGTGVADSSGKNNNGAIVGGAAFVEGVNGKALLFDGASYVNIPTNPSLDMVNTMSVSLWVKIDPASVSMATIIAKGHTHFGGIRGWALRVNSDTMPGEAEFFGGVNGIWQTAVFPGMNPPDNAWHLLTGVKDRSGIHVYVDGVPRNSNTAATGDFNSVSEFDLRIGDDVINQGRTIKGAIDEVRIYNYALSATEVQKYYTMTRLSAAGM